MPYEGSNPSLCNFFLSNLVSLPKTRASDWPVNPTGPLRRLCPTKVRTRPESLPGTCRLDRNGMRLTPVCSPVQLYPRNQISKHYFLANCRLYLEKTLIPLKLVYKRMDDFAGVSVKLSSLQSLWKDVIRDARMNLHSLSAA